MIDVAPTQEELRIVNLAVTGWVCFIGILIDLLTSPCFFQWQWSLVFSMKNQSSVHLFRPEHSLNVVLVWYLLTVTVTSETLPSPKGGIFCLCDNDRW